jgi:hypothetical protein
MRKDAQKNREDILASAQLLIAQQGTDIALSAIANEAGVGIATLYRNFPTRRDLFLGVAEQLFTQVKHLAETYLEQWDTDPTTTWHDFVHELARLRTGMLAIQLAESSVLDLDSDAVLALRDSGIAAVDPLLDKAKQAGLVDPAIDIVHFQVGLATITRPLPNLPLLRLDPRQEWLVDIYLRGIAPEQ